MRFVFFGYRFRTIIYYPAVLFLYVCAVEGKFLLLLKLEADPA